jgi:hypothetical protein
VLEMENEIARLKEECKTEKERANGMEWCTLKLTFVELEARAISAEQKLENVKRMLQSFKNKSQIPN